MPKSTTVEATALPEADDRYNLYAQWLKDTKGYDCDPDVLMAAIQNYGRFQTSDANREFNEQRKAGNAEQREAAKREREEAKAKRAQEREQREAARKEAAEAKAAAAQEKAANAAKQSAPEKPAGKQAAKPTAKATATKATGKPRAARGKSADAVF